MLTALVEVRVVFPWLQPWEEVAVRRSPGKGDTTTDRVTKAAPLRRGPEVRIERLVGPRAHARGSVRRLRPRPRLLLPVLELRGPVLNHPDNRRRRVFEGFGDDEALPIRRNIIRMRTKLRPPPDDNPAARNSLLGGPTDNLGEVVMGMIG